MDLQRIEAAVREILLAIGEDPHRDGLIDTPARVARMYAEVFAGLENDPAEVLTVTFAEDHREMVILRDIPFASFCEHHLLPFTGMAHVGYIPNGQIIGLSKLARLVETFARRPQVQERMTSAIADTLMDTLVSVSDMTVRKRAWTEVQNIVNDMSWLIWLPTVNAKIPLRNGFGNAVPTVIPHQLLWNIDRVFVKKR